VKISQLWAETYADPSGRICGLYYDRKTKQPQELHLLKDFSVGIRPFSFSVGIFRDWKLPEPQVEGVNLQQG